MPNTSPRTGHHRLPPVDLPTPQAAVADDRARDLQRIIELEVENLLDLGAVLAHRDRYRPSFRSVLAKDLHRLGVLVRNAIGNLPDPLANHLIGVPR